MLVDSLHLGQNIPTVLQSLGCIAQHCVSAFESQEKEITRCILQEVFPLIDVSKSNELNLFEEPSECCISCKLKIFALKTLVRSFLPNNRARVNREINHLLDIITQMLQTGSFGPGTNPCCSDVGNIRLAAAKSVLRLSRKWDLHISPLIFRLTLLVAKDHNLSLRRLFVNKVHKLLQEHAIPSRYACVFSFAELDSEDLRNNSLKHMGEYIKTYGEIAGMYKGSGFSGGSIDHPAYMIVFLIHVLAHDTDFPIMDCRDEEIYIKFISPLVFSLQTLLNPSSFDGDLEVINGTASYLWSIFHAIKRAEDAIDAQMTPKLHELAVFGISMLNTLEFITVSRSGNPKLILLPSSLYKMGLAESIEVSNTSSVHDITCIESLIRKLTHSFGNQNSQTSCTIKKHFKQCYEDSLVTDANKSSKSSLTFCKRADTSRIPIKEQSNRPCSFPKELHETSNQEVYAGGQQYSAVSSFPSRTVELHNEFSTDDDQEIHVNTYSEPIIRNEQLTSSCASVATAPSLDQNEDSSSCLQERDMIMRCESNTAKTSKFSTANHEKLNIAKGNKDKGEAIVVKHIQVGSPTDKSNHGEHSSFHGARDIFEAFGCNSERNSMKEKAKFCGKEIPLPENVKKVQRSQIAEFKTIDVNEDNIARRTRRRKV